MTSAGWLVSAARLRPWVMGSQDVSDVLVRQLRLPGPACQVGGDALARAALLAAPGQICWPRPGVVGH